jgi:hypothetical protein
VGFPVVRADGIFVPKRYIFAFQTKKKFFVKKVPHVTGSWIEIDPSTIKVQVVKPNLSQRMDYPGIKYLLLLTCPSSPEIFGKGMKVFVEKKFGQVIPRFNAELTDDLQHLLNQK